MKQLLPAIFLLTLFGACRKGTSPTPEPLTSAPNRADSVFTGAYCSFIIENTSDNYYYEKWSVNGYSDYSAISGGVFNNASYRTCRLAISTTEITCVLTGRYDNDKDRYILDFSSSFDSKIVRLGTWIDKYASTTKEYTLLEGYITVASNSKRYVEGTFNVYIKEGSGKHLCRGGFRIDSASIRQF